MSGLDPAALALDARGIARRFADVWVLRGVDLSVDVGEVVGLLGANGSGKSTLLRIVSTLIRPHAGQVSVFGRDVLREGNAARALIGYLGHAPGLYDDLTARENLRFAAAMLDRGANDVDATLERVGLSFAADDPVRGFSSGMQRRLALGRLMLTRPRLLLLDEPYSNLDSEGIGLVNGLIADHVAAGGAAVIVLHELAPASGLLDRTVTLVDGRLADSASVNDGTTMPVLVSRA